MKFIWNSCVLMCYGCCVHLYLCFFLMFKNVTWCHLCQVILEISDTLIYIYIYIYKCIVVIFLSRLETEMIVHLWQQHLHWWLTQWQRVYRNKQQVSFIFPWIILAFLCLSHVSSQPRYPHRATLSPNHYLRTDPRLYTISPVDMVALNPCRY